MRTFIYIILISAFLLIAGNETLAQERFFVDPIYDYAGRDSVSAVLEKESKTAYFYVDEKAEVSSGVLKYLASELDNNIYPTLTAFFGAEWRPGIDNDEKITILLQRMHPDVGGYFREEDEVMRESAPRSNEREMVYLNTETLSKSDFDSKGPSYLAHELMHLISFNQKQKRFQLKEERWLEEVRAEYAPTLLGYNDTYEGSLLEQRLNTFLALPADSLLEWRDTPNDHAAAAIFSHYLVGRFGANILKDTLHKNSVGIASFSRDFSDIFLDWTIALYLNRQTAAYGSKYTFDNPYLQYTNLHILPSATYSLGKTTEMRAIFPVQEWSPRWLRFLPRNITEKGGILRLALKNLPDGEGLFVPYILTDKEGTIDVRYAQIREGRAVAHIPEFGSEIISVVFVPFVPGKIAGFDGAEERFTYQVEAEIAERARYQEGEILRARGQNKAYVVKRGYLRWLQAPEIIDFYGHLSWGTVRQVSEEEIEAYQESFLIRKAGDYKVYEVDKNGGKRWLNMTSRQFEQSGRRWEAVYTVNEKEFSWFR